MSKNITIKKRVILFIKKHFLINYNLKWDDIEYFDEIWKIRIKEMALLIDEERVILDLGCGKAWLKEYLSKDKIYFGCDYKIREDNIGQIIICDFNKKQFPNINVDCCFISGCLEYVDDVDWFLNSVSKCCNSIILSYNPTDIIQDINIRKSNAWVNHLSLDELVNKINNYGFKCVKTGPTVFGNVIMKFKKDI